MDKPAIESNKLPDLTHKVRLIRPLGFGEEGTTYLAEYYPDGIKRPVAVKIVTPAFMIPHPEARIATIKDLNSPFILHPLEFGLISYEGKIKYIQILPLADGNLETLAPKLTLQQIITVFLHTYWGFADAIKNGVIWGWDFSPSQILLFNTDSDQQILARLSDFGSFKDLSSTRMQDVRKTLNAIISHLLSQLFYRDWLANKSKSTASEYQYDMGFLRRSEVARKNFLSDAYVSCLPKSIISQFLLLADEELPHSLYFRAVQDFVERLAREYRVNPYQDIDIFVSSFLVVRQ